MKRKNKETGNANWLRKHYYNKTEPDVDIPDGDVQVGKKLFKQNCLGCHQMEINTPNGPSLKTVYGRKIGAMKFNYSKAMRGEGKNWRWSRHRLYMFLEDPQSMFTMTDMLYDGLKSSYERACVIEYLHSLKTDRIPL